MTYSITREIRLHSQEDDWFYQFIDDGEGNVEVAPYTTHGIEERSQEIVSTFPKIVLTNLFKFFRN